MSSKQPIRGWLTVLGGFLVHLSLGTLYSFGNMTSYFTSYIREHTQGPADLRYTQTIWIFGVAATGQGAAMFVGGLLSSRVGARVTVLIGCLLQSGGIALTGLAVQSSFGLSIFTYGIMAGLGTGIAYAPPMACAMRWLPQYKGLVNGIVVAGFGGGSFIFNLVQTAFINPDNLSPDLPISPGSSEKYFSEEKAGALLARVPLCFYLLGGCYAGLQLVGVMLICEPPSQQEPSESDSLVDNALNVSTSEDLEPMKDSPDVYNMTTKEMLRTKSFYILWFTFLVNGITVLFISTLYKTYGQTFIGDDRFLSLVGAFASVGNSVGRIGWGVLADRFPYKCCMLVQCSLMVSLMCTLIATPSGGKAMFFIWIVLIFTDFSGSFSVFPTVTARAFGPRHVAVNYGLVFSANAVTGLLGPLLTNALSGLLGWEGMFFLIAGFSLIGVVLTLSFNVKDKNGKDI